ncbi:MAG: hypothetical protein PHE24_01610 [Patescibacteria group bacterium]|nr:hypothetical protein [Patescibacteria group bacterium]
MESTVKAPAERKLIATFHNVARRVDKVVVERNETGLHLVAANAQIGIVEHYQRGVVVQGRILNMHFYGLAVGDLGRKLNFRIDVYEKTVGTKTYTYVDLHKVNAVPEADLKINIEDPKLGGDVAIAGTSAFLRIEPRPVRTQADEPHLEELVEADSQQ